jgi:hypothetical protein
MKKLAIALAAFGALAIATPVFACPGHDGDKSTDAPKTAEKSEDKEKKAPAKKKDTKKTDKKDTEKKDGDKVSMK